MNCGRARPVIYGEVLFDRFPDGRDVLGGAPFNVAWNLQALGQQPIFISRVGNDRLGNQIRDAMCEWGFDMRFLQVDSEHATGTVDVTFVDQEPCYDIVHDCAYDFIEPVELNALPKVELLYHGSLALRAEQTRRTFAALVSHDVGPRFLDVNLREPWWERKQVLELIERASWVKLSQDELNELHGNEAPESARSVRADALQFRRRYDLQALILTSGESGACWIDSQHVVDVKPQAGGTVVDTVGAGDAFASVVLTGLLQGWSVEIMLERAQRFASAVVGLRGATSSDKLFYSDFARLWGIASDQP